MAQQNGRYWPEQMDRFHPYGRGYGRGRVHLRDMPGAASRVQTSLPLGFMVDRAAGPPPENPAKDHIPKISDNFVSASRRLTREFVLFAHHLPPNLGLEALRRAVNQQLGPYGAVTFDRNNSRTSIKINLVNHCTKPDFDPTARSCQYLLLDGTSHMFTAVFQDVKKRLVRTEEVNYKQIEAHMVLADSFDRQVHLIREQTLLTAEDLALRDELRDFFENLLNFKDYDCELHLIGSSVSGLGLRDSDFDVFIRLRDYDMKYEPIHRNDAVNLLAGIRNVFRHEFNMHIQHVINARCPIIRMDFKKLPHNATGLECDLSISNVLGTYNSKIMKHFLESEPLFRDLAALIKYWLSARGLIGPNQITSYGCLLMVMFYLQSVLVLPSLYQLQFSVDHDLVEGRWNVAFDPSPHFFTYCAKDGVNTDPDADQAAGTSASTGLKKPSLSSLFLGFFNFYAKFPFGKKVICPHYGSTREKSDLLLQHEFRSMPFSIQDLIQLNSNVGQNMTDAFFAFFRNLFKLVDHLIACFSPSLSDDEAAKKILVKMIESIDDKMVDQFDVTQSIFQDQLMPRLLIKATTIDVTQEFLKTWSSKSLDIVEKTLRDVLQLTEYSRIDLLQKDVPVTHQSFIGQFLLVVRGSEHLIWQKRNDVRRLVDPNCSSSSANFIDVEKQVTQKIREDLMADEGDIEVDITTSDDDDVVYVSERAVGVCDVSLSFKLLINFSINSQLVEIRFEKEEEEIALPDNKKKFWTRELKVFLSNYLLDHVQHAYAREYS